MVSSTLLFCIENKFWEIQQIFIKLFKKILCVCIFLFLLWNMYEIRKGMENKFSVPRHLKLVPTKNPLLIHAKEVPGLIIFPWSYSPPTLSPEPPTYTVFAFGMEFFLSVIHTYIRPSDMVIFFCMFRIYIDGFLLYVLFSSFLLFFTWVGFW